MNQTEAISVLEKIQREFDTRLLVYKGKNVWPILRYYLALALMKSEAEEANDKASPVPDQGKNAHSSKIDKLMSLLELPITKRKWSAQKNNFDTKDCEVLFVSPWFESFPDSVDGKKYCRYLDPYIETLSKTKKTLKLQLLKNGQEPGNTLINAIGVNEDLFLEKVRSEKRINTALGRNNSENAIYGLLHELNKYVEENKINYTFNRWLVDHLNEANEYEELFYDLLKNTGLKTVCFECYYSPCIFGLISACKRLQIASVDIQHGNIDINYLGWNNVPAAVTNYLPQFYWVWSKQDRDQVSRDNDLIKPVMGGNMWLKKCVADSSVGKLKDEIFSQYEKRILVSLQYNMFLGYTLKLVTEAIEKGNKNYLWMFRIHPLNTPDERKQIEQSLSEFSNVEYRITTQANLFSVLQTADMHVVASSAVAREGLQFNLPAIIIHGQGADLFRELIDRNVFCTAFTANSILKQIENFKPAGEAKDFKIEISEQQALACFNQISFKYNKAA